jgi:hypothetical protein
MYTVLINNREGMVHAQLPHQFPTQKGAAPRVGRAVILMPGVNLVDSKTLATLMENHAFKALFETVIPPSLAPEQTPEKVGKPILQIDRSIGKNGEVEEKAPLQKLSTAQCEAMIRETFSVDLLKRWTKEETRGDIRRLLVEQVERLETGGESKGPASPAE